MLTCDDMGFCGEPNDPGCQGCALTQGSCTDALATCQQTAANACVDLNQCYLDCADKDTACQMACATQYPDGVGPLDALVTCVYCVECPISCAVMPDSCPM